MKMILIICILVACLLESCATFYTKAFHLKDTFETYGNKRIPCDQADEHRNILNDPLDGWLISISIQSVCYDNHKEFINENGYSVKLHFLNKSDSITIINSLDSIWVDSIKLKLFALDSVIVLAGIPTAINYHNRFTYKGGLYFGRPIIPEFVDSIGVGFTAILFDGSGIKKSQKEFKFNLLKYEHKKKDLPSGLMM